MYPAPVRDQLLGLLRQHHREAGVTTAELAEHMGRTTANINSYLCKLSQYGVVLKIPERKDSGPRPHELNRWRLPDAR
jgi:predicted transcriptional regulator